MQLKAKQPAPKASLRNIHGQAVEIPDLGGTWMHLQFHRFAGCPICNVHLRSYVTRINALKQAAIREVVLFHSPTESLLPYQGSFPFDVVGDPTKALYQTYGVEASLLAIVNPMGWGGMFRAILDKDKPKGGAEGGPLGLPADFLISADGQIAAVKYGRHASDSWSVDEVIALANGASSKTAA